MPSLVLYHMEHCTFCAKVRRYLSEHKITIPMKEINTTPAFRDELIKVGGKGQVPCLVIDGKALYESNDIIEWFMKNSKGLSKG